MKTKLQEIKNWNTEIEKEITENWKKSEMFRIDAKTKKKVYSIDTPPPYVNAPIHMGHAVTMTYMDFFARYKRTKGYEVLFPLGLDRNGLPIEMAAEKKYGTSPFVVGREKFVEMCEQLLNETSNESTDSFAKLGISFTSYEEGNHVGSVYKTDSEEYRAMTQATFIELYKKGLIYEDRRINNWDPKLRTTIADSEIEYKNLPSKFNYVRWKVKETGEDIAIATTRPELICTCGMVVFNPKDRRYKRLEGKTAVSPLFEKEVKIKSHSLASIDKGTGLVMMCSAGDLSDIQFFREQKISPVIAINQDGTMNDNAGFLKGLKVRAAREKIIDELMRRELLVKQEEIIHRTPVSERSGAEVEFIEMPEFYLKQIEFKEQMRKLAKKINFYPIEAKKILDDWIDSIVIDWPISRRRYYATPIPLWHSSDVKFVAVPLAGSYYQPWKNSPPKDAEVFENGKKIGIISDFKTQWKGDERVLDTWMDSSLSALFILQYKKNDSFFKKTFPATLRPQGKEIVRTWLYYSLLRGYLETGKPCFDDIWIHQHILDEKGRKMSKSLGNVIDPQDILREEGAEALRFWAATEGDLSKQDLSCSRERIRGEVKTLNKLLNVAKFVSLFDKKEKVRLTALDSLFIDYIEDITARIDENYNSYDFYHPTIELRKFLWDTFASHYIELVKARAYNENGDFSNEESDSAKYTLHFLLQRLLFLMHPIVPQITSFIAQGFCADLLRAQWPKAKKSKSDFILVEKIMEFNSTVWKMKKEKGISLKEKISGLKIPTELKEFEKDLKACHGLS